MKPHDKIRDMAYALVGILDNTETPSGSSMSVSLLRKVNTNTEYFC